MEEGRSEIAEVIVSEKSRSLDSDVPSTLGVLKKRARLRSG